MALKAKRGEKILQKSFGSDELANGDSAGRTASIQK
jgi:hypothetical protein